MGCQTYTSKKRGTRVSVTGCFERVRKGKETRKLVNKWDVRRIQVRKGKRGSMLRVVEGVRNRKKKKRKEN